MSTRKILDKFLGIIHDSFGNNQVNTMLGAAWVPIEQIINFIFEIKLK